MSTISSLSTEKKVEGYEKQMRETPGEIPFGNATQGEKKKRPPSRKDGGGSGDEASSGRRNLFGNTGKEKPMGVLKKGKGR